MSRKQLVSLFIVNLIPYTAGSGLLALMPIYLSRHGISAVQIGFYIAAIFAALAAGTISSGWLSSHLGRRKIFILIAAIINPILAFLMGQVGDVTLFLALAIAFWFVGGIQVSMVSILAGMFAEADRRGRVFGIIGTSTALAQMLSGLFVGPIVDHWGFPALFSAAAGVYLFQFPVALFTQDKPMPRIQPKRQTAAVSVTPVSNTLLMILAGSVLVNAASHMAALSRPLVMSALDFDMTAISSAIGISGALNLPLPFLMGWLSDRIGRRGVLMVCYLAVALGVGILGASTMIWHFWLSQILITLLGSALVVGSALITDLVPPEQLSLSLSRFSVTPWIGGVLGYAFTGMALQRLGLSLTFAIGAGLPLLGVILLIATRDPRNLFSATNNEDKRQHTRNAIAQTPGSVGAPGR